MRCGVIDSGQIRVLIAEDEAPLREALADLIRGEPGMELVGAAASADDAIECAADCLPDVAVVDVRMPGGGTTAARGICERSPRTRVIALSAYEDQATVLNMLRAGAVGYLVKGVAAGEILEAVRRSMRGQASLSIDVTADVAEVLTAELADRMHGQEVLRRSEARFRSLLESAPDGVVIVGEDGTIVLVNAQAELLFGYHREDLHGLPIETLLPDRVRGRHAAHRSAYLSEPETRPMGIGLELAGRRQDGTEFPVDISLSSLETQEGRVVTAFIRDITERRQTEEATRRSEESLGVLLESAPDGVVIADSGGRVTFVNRQIETLFGYQRTELVGQALELLLPERLRDRHVVHRGVYLADPRTRPMGAGLDLKGRRKDGSEFPVDISLATVNTTEGPMLTAFVRDVTERRGRELLERDLAERRRLLAHLVAAGEAERSRIAGDIHDDSIQAITAAGMRLQILRRSLDDPEQLQLLSELEQTIQLSIRRLRHLLFELRPPILDNDGLSAAVELYLEQADTETDTQYRLENKLESEPGHDTRTILYRIVQEALTNVRKHAGAATATVLLDNRNGGYLVRIIDDGVGFEVDNASSAVPGHVGLVAMQERAKLAGGWLRVDSAPGRGTTIEAYAPASLARAGIETEEPR